MVGSRRQGWAIYARDGRSCSSSASRVVYAAEQHGSPRSTPPARHGQLDGSTGGNLEGKEQRFGIADSARCGRRSRPSTSCGAVNAALESLTGLGGAVPIVEHDDRRGRLRRRRLRPLLDAAVRPARGLHRRADGRPHARVPRQEDRGARDQADADRDARRAAAGAVATALAIAHQVRRAVDLQRAARRASPRRSTPTSRRPTTTARRSPATPASSSRTRPATPAPSGSRSPTCSAACAMLVGRFVPMLAVLAVAGSLAGKRVAPAGLGHDAHRHADLRRAPDRRDRARRARSPSSPPSCSARSSRA